MCLWSIVNAKQNLQNLNVWFRGHYYNKMSLIYKLIWAAYRWKFPAHLREALTSEVSLTFVLWSWRLHDYVQKKKKMLWESHQCVQTPKRCKADRASSAQLQEIKKETTGTNWGVESGSFPTSGTEIMFKALSLEILKNHLHVVSPGQPCSGVSPFEQRGVWPDDLQKSLPNWTHL